MDPYAALSPASPAGDFQKEIITIPEHPGNHQLCLRKIEDINPDGEFVPAPNVIVNERQQENSMSIYAGINEHFFTFLLMSKLQRLEIEQTEAEKIMELLEGVEKVAVKS